MRRRADGAGSEELLYRYDKGPLNNMSDWSADGRFLIYSQGGDVIALPVGPDTDASRQPMPLVQTPATEFGATVSADGRWLAYISNESGRQEIYVQPLAEGGQKASIVSAGGKWIVSRGTLGMARWRRDGGELVFVDANGVLMSVDIQTTPVFRNGRRAKSFNCPAHSCCRAPTLARSATRHAISSASCWRSRRPKVRARRSPSSSTGTRTCVSSPR